MGVSFVVNATRNSGRISIRRSWLAVTIVLFMLIPFGMAFGSGKDENVKVPKVLGSDYISPSDPAWQRAKQEVNDSVLDLLVNHRNEVAKNLPWHRLSRGKSTLKEIALTFDDGPHPAYTPKILEILKRYNVKATFFVVGEMAAKYPDLVRSEILAGHSVGNHTYHHVNLTKVRSEDVAVEIKACGDIIKAITGKAPHLFRPPGGDYDKSVSMVATALGYTTVLWTDDPGDYASPGEKVIDARLLTSVNNGGIILIHDGIEQTIEVLPYIIQTLQSRGYKLVTIDQMIKDKNR
jgi:peptidoglycan/xylan/chitin deacetylase (PgdA/CDA1 family)